MSNTTDEFFAGHEATRRLVENLKSNLEAMASELTSDDREALLRVDLIVIRQCLEDFGVE